MRILGLDISTKTGIAIVDYEYGGIPTIVAGRELQFKGQKDMKRVKSMHNAVLKFMEEWNPDVAFIEGYGYGNTNTLVTLAEVGTGIRLAVYDYGIDYVEVPPTSLKLFIAGKGNADKEQMMNAIYSEYGYTAATDNVADAVGLALFGAGCYGFESTTEALRAVKKVMESSHLPIICT